MLKNNEFWGNTLLESINSYLDNFFEVLEIYDDIYESKNNKKNFSHVIRNFLNASSVDNAMKVYEAFCTAYWMSKDDDSFLRLLNEMRMFEENAGILTEKQRDHFTHSVNVFLLGLAIYNKNEKYRSAFEKKGLNKQIYPDSYDTAHEEFFYRWGIAALFHDIAYPIEITFNQLKRYLNFISVKCGITEKVLEASVFIKNTDVFNLLPQMKPKKEFFNEFFEKHPDFSQFHINSLSLIAKEISNSIGVDFDKIKDEMFNYVNKMDEGGHVDHGYYSALIVLRWFYQLMLTQEWNPIYFYFPVVNASTAIILHNYYKYGLMNEPFNLKKLDVEQHPLSYLLILCDELQDWNRKPYGEKDIHKTSPNDILLYIDNNKMLIKYVFNEEDYQHDNYCRSKYDNIIKVLNVESVFSNNIQII